MTGTLLVFHVEGQRLRRLKLLCASNRVQMRVMPQNAWGQTLDAILRGEQAEEMLDAPQEEMLVMCDFTPAQLDAVLDGFSQKFEPVRYKAVLTAFNRSWTCVQLLEELKAEREALSKGMKRHGEQ